MQSHAIPSTRLYLSSYFMSLHLPILCQVSTRWRPGMGWPGNRHYWRSSLDHPVLCCWNTCRFARIKWKKGRSVKYVKCTTSLLNISFWILEEVSSGFYSIVALHGSSKIGPQTPEQPYFRCMSYKTVELMHRDQLLESHATW